MCRVGDKTSQSIKPVLLFLTVAFKSTDKATTLLKNISIYSSIYLFLIRPITFEHTEMNLPWHFVKIFFGDLLNIITNRSGIFIHLVYHLFSFSFIYYQVRIVEDRNEICVKHISMSWSFRGVCWHTLLSSFCFFLSAQLHHSSFPHINTHFQCFL